MQDCIDELTKEMEEKDREIVRLKKVAATAPDATDSTANDTTTTNETKDDDTAPDATHDAVTNSMIIKVTSIDNDDNKSEDNDAPPGLHFRDVKSKAMTMIEEINLEIVAAEEYDKQWSVDDAQSGNLADLPEDKLKNVFEEFDEDGGGSIDADELQKAMKKFGQDLTINEINDLIDEIDENGDGEVDFNEFKVMVGKTWFVQAYQTNLQRSVTQMMDHMATQTSIDSDGIGSSDDVDSKDNMTVKHVSVMSDSVLQSKLNEIDKLNAEILELREYERMVDDLKKESNQVNNKYQELLNEYNNYKNTKNSEFIELQKKSDTIKDELGQVREQLRVERENGMTKTQSNVEAKMDEISRKLDNQGNNIDINLDGIRDVVKQENSVNEQNIQQISKEINILKDIIGDLNQKIQNINNSSNNNNNNNNDNSNAYINNNDSNNNDVLNDIRKYLSQQDNNEIERLKNRIEELKQDKYEIVNLMVNEQNNSRDVIKNLQKQMQNNQVLMQNLKKKDEQPRFFWF